MADRVEKIAFSRSVEVRHSVDVFVAGGGPAGIAAAVVAARQGASVFLAESQGCLGGMGTAGMLPVFMPFGDSRHFYAGGFGRELYDRLEAYGATLPGPRPGDLMPIIKCEPLKRIYDDMIGRAGVACSLATQLVAVEAHGSRVSHAVCAAKSGIFAVAAKIFVDGTGDGDLAAWAGAPFEKGDESAQMMGGTLCSLWVDVDWTKVRESGLDAERVLADALRRDPSVLPHVDPHLPGVWRLGATTGGGNVGHAYGVDGTDERSLTRAFIESRALLPYYERFYRGHLRGFEAASVAATAPLFGVRESRRIVGDYVLTGDDYHRCASFDDEIGRYHYWIDTHLSRPSLEEWEEHLKLRRNERAPGDCYGIPFRVLTPRGLENVLVAGRCVSADRAIQSSIRVMPGCFITGQAAGMAAAMAAAAGGAVRGISASELRARLRTLGAFLP